MIEKTSAFLAEINSPLIGVGGALLLSIPVNITPELPAPGVDVVYIFTIPCSANGSTLETPIEIPLLTNTVPVPCVWSVKLVSDTKGLIVLPIIATPAARTEFDLTIIVDTPSI